jgi:RecA-family ATPase
MAQQEPVEFEGSTDDFIKMMELDELDEKMSPRDYGKLRGISPQLVYYHIREGHVKLEKCICGRSVVDVELADEYFKKGKFADE